jgi:hypothetical protein
MQRLKSQRHQIDILELYRIAWWEPDSQREGEGEGGQVSAKQEGEGKKRYKAIPEAIRGGPWDCETSRLPHFLDNLLI